MNDIRLFDVDGPVRDRVRAEFDAIAPILTEIYAALTWPQKAVLLNSILEAGDHPPGFDLRHDGQPRKARS